MMQNVAYFFSSDASDAASHDTEAVGYCRERQEHSLDQDQTSLGVPSGGRARR